jgi:hypothetical protein
MEQREGDLFSLGNFAYELKLEDWVEIYKTLSELEEEGKVKELKVYRKTKGGPDYYWMRTKKKGQDTKVENT